MGSVGVRGGWAGFPTLAIVSSPQELWAVKNSKHSSNIMVLQYMYRYRYVA